MQGAFDSFGLVERKSRKASSLDAVMDAFQARDFDGATFLPFGNGRSYGDSCHNDAGDLVPMRPLARIGGFDASSGVLEAEPGVLLSEIIAFAAPHGYFLPVTPGTRFATLGGAIANDVHGKNHHRKGTLGCHVESFDLLRSDGFVRVCSRAENADLFAATIGGMGLTGIVLKVRLKLARVGSLDIEERTLPFRSLDEFFDLADAADAQNEYAVAWVDQLATGASTGRGLLITGNHMDNGNFSLRQRQSRLGVPLELPISALNTLSLKAFNTAYFHIKGRRSEPHRVGYEGFFYPLDGVSDWNRLYGPKGLFQHQSVISGEAAPTVIPAMLEASRRAGQVSFLTVLKRFGDVQSPGLLSFPQPGYTLTVDFPNKGRKTLELLETLDRMTVEAGGRVNPYKDQRMSAAIFKQGFPCWPELEKLRDPAFCSNYWRRTALAQPN
ncbi:MAG: FAD-binding oxidoreductase [Phyllobacterium sp.]